MASVIDFKGAERGALIGGVTAGAIGADFKPAHPEAMGGMTVLPFFQPMINDIITRTRVSRAHAGLGELSTRGPQSGDERSTLRFAQGAKQFVVP